MKNQRVQAKTLPISEERLSTFRHTAQSVKRSYSIIGKAHGENKGKGGRPYYAGGPRISEELLRRLDVLSRAHHNATHPFSRGVYSYVIRQLEREILLDRGGIFDDR